MSLDFVPPPAVIELTAPFEFTYGDLAGDVTFSMPDGFFDQPTPMFIDSNARTFLFSPISSYLNLQNAKPGETATFAIDGTVVGTRVVQNDRSANITATSGLLAKGTHYFTAEVDGVTVRLAFYVKRSPNIPLEALPDDRDPVITAGALQPDGRYKWVLQDLAFQGIGSWVMPINPTSMAPLPKQRSLSANATTSVLSGRQHVTEAQPAPREWSFTGFCPDFEFYTRISQYAELNRRFYLIDHRNRAWVVTFSSLEMKPRKRIKNDDGKFNDWVHDYTVRAVIYDPTPKTPM